MGPVLTTSAKAPRVRRAGPSAPSTVKTSLSPPHRAPPAHAREPGDGHREATPRPPAAAPPAPRHRPGRRGAGVVPAPRGAPGGAAARGGAPPPPPVQFL